MYFWNICHPDVSRRNLITALLIYTIVVGVTSSISRARSSRNERDFAGFRRVVVPLRKSSVCRRPPNCRRWNFVALGTRAWRLGAAGSVLIPKDSATCEEIGAVRRRITTTLGGPRHDEEMCEGVAKLRTRAGRFTIILTDRIGESNLVVGYLRNT